MLFFDQVMFRGAWPESVTRVMFEPLVLAIQRSSPVPECRKAIAYYLETKCFLKHERSFLRPVFA